MHIWIIKEKGKKKKTLKKKRKILQMTFYS
jgi:hypothetical protein